MTKKTSYFSHDSNARNDEKILALRMKHGAEGYGIYFMLIERLRDEADYTSFKDYNMIAFELRVSAEKVKSVIHDFGLFTFTDDGKRFYSDSFMERMKQKDEKSEKARKSALSRWNNNERNANASKKECDSNALKESKVKKEKNNTPLPPKGDDEKKIPDWKTDFKIYLNELREEYKLALSDDEWILKHEKLNPGVNIQLSVEKACVNYWATKETWTKQKRRKIKNINWRSTFANAVSQKMNRVYKNQFPVNIQPEKRKLEKPVKW